jgi:hypothetical protein
MVVVHGGRNPFELWLLSACVLSGLAGLITPGANNSVINKLLPGWEVQAWYAGLLLIGAVALYGAARQKMLVERVGMAIMSALTLLYSVAVLAAAGDRAAFIALLVAAFSAACITRVVQINRDLRVLSRAATGSLDPDGR